jgi:hypothetical protein
MHFGIFLAVACGAVVAALVNLVQNGSFESITTDWAFGGSRLQSSAAITSGAAAAHPIGAYGKAVPQYNAVTHS